MRGLFKQDDGVTAVEFALVSGPLIYMMIGIIELSLMFFTQHLMENASFNIARLSKTGYVVAGKTQVETIRDLMNKKTLGLVDPAKVGIVARAYSNYSAVGKPEPFVDANGNGIYDVGENFTDVNGNEEWDADQGVLAPGQAGQVVVYDVTYPWHMITPLLNNIIGDHGAFTMKTSIIVKNEPYSVQ